MFFVLRTAIFALGLTSWGLFLGSCSSISKSHLNQSVHITIEAPMAAKIDVDMTKKLTGYASGGYFLHLFRVSGDNKFTDNIRFNGAEPGFFSFLSKVASVKAAAFYNAIRMNPDADILVNPQYVVEENHWNPFYKLIKVKVTGYPGRLVSLKNKL